MTLTPQAFVAKWRAASAKERSAYQEHFIDLCHLVGHPTPMEADASGQTFAFEAGAAKAEGGHGWADVFKPGHFAWEYKGPHADLDAAYQQLLQYRESLRNPPLLIVSDLARIILHTNFTNTVKKVYSLSLDDVLTPDGPKILRAAFFEPETLRARQTTAEVTRAAAEEFARLAELLRKWNADAERSAHFLIRLLFCLFAEDAGLLPGKLFSRLLQAGRRNPKLFTAQLKQLFGAMAAGGAFGVEVIPHFNGGLFDDDAVIELDSDGLEILARVSALDWSSIEPSIFGTLFERSLDPAKRAQLGAHYTSKDDILLIVEPVLMKPLRAKWEKIKEEGKRLASQEEGESKKGKLRKKAQTKLKSLLTGFAAELAATKVLDPACGSGNFLYVSLRALLDLEKEVIALAGEWGVGRFFPSVSPAQLAGIEINPYAHELAQITIWIGYIQWLMENGFGFPAEPILKPLRTIRYMDAIMDIPPGDLPVTEPDWPEADVLVGNPPFLGDKKMRAELGDEYVDALRKLYEGRIPGQSDLVCYWFEKARAMIETRKVKRAGLLATQAIRGGANRKVLERIKQTGDIFWAQSDREWILDGATVHVSMIAFDNRQETKHELDSQTVSSVNPDLTSAADLTTAKPLVENEGLAFIGDMKKGKFDLPATVALPMQSAPLNPNGKSNRDVIKRWINGLDITRRPQNMWIVDFGVDMSETEAALYEQPFEYVRRHVKPERDKVRNPLEKSRWWLHGRPAPDLREAVKGLPRYIATARVAKHRLFVYVDASTIPDGQVVVIACDDDYFFGVLHSKIHELWARATGTQLREAESGFRYTPTTTFETFPFPWPPGQEPKADARVRAIAEAARELNEWRERWLNPDPTPGPSPVRSARAATGEGGEAKKRTLTNLYNARPTWLDNAHKKLDAAVFAAYGWPGDLSDDEILEKLLAENLKRAE